MIFDALLILALLLVAYAAHRWHHHVERKRFVTPTGRVRLGMHARQARRQLSDDSEGVGC